VRARLLRRGASTAEPGGEGKERETVLLETLRVELLAATRRAVEAGLLPGTAGNLSVRDAESGLIVITPSQIPYHRCAPEDMVVIDQDLRVVEGRHAPSSERRMHLALYRARPDAGAIVHTHSPYATAFAVLERSIPFAIAEMSLIGGSVPVAPFDPPGTEELGINAARVMGDGPVVLLGKHGTVALGPDLERALNRAVILEDAARIYHLALQVGQPAGLTAPDLARIAAARRG
jgi:ribulose-5-phosphate 4-epimerase/fuculose-1-phosphate aldolase